MKLKGRECKTVVRPVMVYGAETWRPVKENASKKLDVVEMKMLKWVCLGVWRDKGGRDEK